ncbi:MAG: glycosyltransferase [Kiritimatiellae bacterium]|nr:glycosyltransferase [Kiritimatiellia bacterium]
MKPLRLVYSMADQDLQGTQSIGIFNVSRGLMHALVRSEQVSRMVILANETLPLPRSLPEWISVQRRNLPLRGRLGRLWWDQVGVYAAADATGLEWLFLPKGFASFLRDCPLRLAAYVHDTIPLHYRERYPHVYRERGLWYFRRCFFGTLQQAEVLFTNSEFSRQCVLDAAARLGKKVPHVVVAGIGFDATQDLMPPKENLVVCPASPWPHKLTNRIVDFLEQWRVRSGFNGTLAMVGRTPPDMPRPSAPSWVWYERMPPEEFEILLARARVLVYPSEFEGFGMPPVEAILVGTCPVYSDIPALRETMKETGFPFRNDDFSSFEQAMESAFGATPDQILAWKKDLLTRHNWNTVLTRIFTALQ